jgi:hypothetical protein
VIEELEPFVENHAACYDRKDIGDWKEAFFSAGKVDETSDKEKGIQYIFPLSNPGNRFHMQRMHCE